MPHVDQFDGLGDPMVHIRLFSDVLKSMGLAQAEKLSLFGRTLLGIAAAWYAKLEDSMKQSWKEPAEAFITQYSYNAQIEVITQDLEVTRQERKESFVEFITRRRAKAAMMTNMPSEKDQIRMVVRNLYGKILQKMIVLPFFSFKYLHQMGVQILDVMKQRIILDEQEPVRKTFVCDSNATRSSSTTTKPSEINIVTTSTKITNPLAETNPQLHKSTRPCS
ncbi:uncharacterized protein LOC114287183 [Camellia sinensis]|uniref:uncharacterized protein LOC114287183 n=1 Tax=Camellia sinensis TaxID=4442 RepID=UPI001035A894|nr:uncharacterized protein LOC114287183 [Camellia sinensis]